MCKVQSRKSRKTEPDLQSGQNKKFRKNTKITVRRYKLNILCKTERFWLFNMAPKLPDLQPTLFSFCKNGSMHIVCCFWLFCSTEKFLFIRTLKNNLQMNH